MGKSFIVGWEKESMRLIRKIQEKIKKRRERKMHRMRKKATGL